MILIPFVLVAGVIVLLAWASLKPGYFLIWLALAILAFASQSKELGSILAVLLLIAIVQSMAEDVKQWRK